MNYAKYENNPKIKSVINKMAAKFGGGMPGAGRSSSASAGAFSSAGPGGFPAGSAAFSTSGPQGNSSFAGAFPSGSAPAASDDLD